jgi:membrane protein DedA with SNARE-associated domain
MRLPAHGEQPDERRALQELIANVSHFIVENRAWTGPIIGALVFGESLAIVGLVIPATALMIAVGSMIGLGVIDPIPVLAWSILGAILGDWVSFNIGRRIGPSCYHRWPLKNHKPSIARARLFFRKYGLISIMLGRFLGPIRATIPLVAGVIGMKRATFQIANIVSAILWVPLVFAPGYFAAQSIGPFEEITELHILGMGLAIVGTMIFGMFAAAKILGGSNRNRRPRRRKATI